jgi:hypothetical protein
LWILLLLLTALILLFPTHLTYEYRAIQSPYIFNSLPIFGVLYYAWLGLLLVLLFTKRGKGKGQWEILALVIIFSLVYLCFWAIIAPDRQPDGLFNIATSKYISSEGTISKHVNVGYLEFPGLHIYNSYVSQITGLGILQSAQITLIIFDIVLAALLFVLFFKTLIDPTLAAFAVLLAIQANWTQSLFAFFWPRFIGLIFLAAFLVMINRKEDRPLGSIQDKIVFIILLAANTISYTVTSMALFLILLGIYLMQIISHLLWKRGKVIPLKPVNTVGWTVVLLSLLVPVAWGIYYAIGMLATVTLFVPKFVQDLSAGQLFGFAFLVGSTNLGTEIPLWASITRWFWLISIYAFGIILALRNLFKLQILSSTEKFETGGLIGIVTLGAIGLVLSPGGFEIQRLFYYAPFFFVPIVLRFINDTPAESASNETALERQHASIYPLGLHIKKYASNILLILFFILSLPTFFAHNSRISTDAYYSYDYSAGEFLESIYGSGEGLNIYYFGDIFPQIVYSGLRNINLYRLSDWAMENHTVSWQKPNNLITSFENAPGGSLFVFSLRGKGYYEHLLAIKPSDPQWSALELRLQNGSKIYDNRYVNVYKPPVLK